MELRNTTAVVASIVRVISPHVGEYMARAAVEGYRTRLNLSPDRLSDEDIEALLRKVGRGLVIFVGEERAAELVGLARAASLRSANRVGEAVDPKP